MAGSEVEEWEANEQNKNLFISALKTTIPVFLGYIPLGIAFGLLLDGAGYHWIYAFLMSLFIYAGSVLGAVLGSLFDLNLEGMSFVLTALFVVLTIEQYFSSNVCFPFIAAIGAGILSLTFFRSENMLLASIILGILILIARERLVKKNLPPMILMLLVIYCLKDVHWLTAPYGIPELFSIGIVAGLHIWKRNTMLSILTGTLLYMVLVQFDIFSF